MRLSRQLIALIVLLLVLVLSGTVAISVRNTRAYLGQQLYSHAQDTATSLGLSLAPALARDDRVLAETMLGAIFDRGDYRAIEVHSIDGGRLLARRSAGTLDDVPTWFIRLASLPAPQAQSVVTGGWRQVGEVQVTANPDPAYRQLWHTALHTSAWVVTLAIAAIAAAALLVGFVLRPLRRVERQAVAVAQRQFSLQERLPRTPELRRVVQAMNLMSAKVRHMLETQTALTEKMRVRAHQDTTTGLQNRRGFEMHMQHLLNAPEEVQSGALALVSLEGFRRINQRHGYIAGDALLCAAARALEQACRRAGHCQLARLGGADFALFFHPATPEDTAAVAEDIQDRLARLPVGDSGETLSAHTGMCWYRPGCTLEELLGRADTAVRIARERGPNTWVVYEPDEHEGSPPPGRAAWQALLEGSLAQGGIALQFQAVRSGRGELLHYEALARLQSEDGGLIPAGVLMPMAVELGVACDLDRAVLKRLRQALAVHDDRDFAVNLSAYSLADADFLTWLRRILDDDPVVLQRVSFEVSERELVRCADAAAAAFAELRTMGARYGMDHVGSTPDTLALLHRLRPDYIKLDGSHIRGIHARADNEFFVRALIDVARHLDVQVIAGCVETEADRDALAEMALDGLQGRLIGSPAASPEH